MYVNESKSSVVIGHSQVSSFFSRKYNQNAYNDKDKGIKVKYISDSFYDFHYLSRDIRALNMEHNEPVQQEPTIFYLL